MISIQCQEQSLGELIKWSRREKSLIFSQILSTNSLRKCMEIGLENLYVDIGSPKICILIIHAWLNQQADKMKQIVHFDWLPEQVRGSSCQFRISCIGSANRSSLFGQVISPLLSKLARSRWLYIGLVFFVCVFIDLEFVLVNKNAKKNLAKIQPPWPHARSITHIFYLYWKA